MSNPEYNTSNLAPMEPDHPTPTKVSHADKYRLILQNVRDFAIFSADLNGRIDEWNTGAERFFGYTEAEILGQPMEVLYVPEDRAGGRVELEKAMAAETGYSEDERWHLHKDGSRFFVSGMVNAMYDDNHNLCGFIKVARDITPRELLRQRLAASEAHHRRLVNAIQDFAIITLDLKGNIKTWNPGATATFGYEAEEVLGKSHGILFTSEGRAQGDPERELANVNREGVCQSESWGVRKDGSCVYLIDVLRLVPTETGQPDTILKVSRDITIRHLTRMKLESTQRELEQNQAELEQKVEHRTRALQQSIHSLEQVLYHVAHDLRAPLRAMEGFTSILVQKFSPRMDAEAERLTARITAAARRMDHLIHDLLVYGRMCHETVRTEKVSLQVAVEAVLISLAGEGRLTDADVEAMPPMLEATCDPNILRLVLRELLANALAFTAPGRRARIRLWSEQIDHRVRLVIEDNGVGIPPEHLDRIFWLFERLDYQASPGTGMGLAIARKGIERMQGSIGVESTTGKGSRFWIELPVISKGSA